MKVFISIIPLNPPFSKEEAFPSLKKRGEGRF